MNKGSTVVKDDAPLASAHGENAWIDAAVAQGGHQIVQEDDALAGRAEEGRGRHLAFV